MENVYLRDQFLSIDTKLSNHYLKNKQLLQQQHSNSKFHLPDHLIQLPQPLSLSQTASIPTAIASPYSQATIGAITAPTTNSIYLKVA